VVFSNGQSSSWMAIPDSKLTRDATELVRESTTDLIFAHSRRVFRYGSWHGQRQGLSFDPELLYVAAMFHDLGMTERFRGSGQRFEIDGADEARRFLERHGLPEERIRRVWTAIARHTRPVVLGFKAPEVELVAAGVEFDVLGIGYHGRSAPAWVRGW
jgi:HD superfamily phosphodiesterase